MGESQSRFSIIDELVRKKTAASEAILEADKSVSDKEHELNVWERNVKLNREQFELDLTKKKDDVNKRVAMLKEQIVEYDKAIAAIQSIQTA